MGACRLFFYQSKVVIERNSKEKLSSSVPNHQDTPSSILYVLGSHFLTDFQESKYQVYLILGWPKFSRTEVHLLEQTQIAIRRWLHGINTWTERMLATNFYKLFSESTRGRRILLGHQNRLMDMIKYDSMAVLHHATWFIYSCVAIVLLLVTFFTQVQFCTPLTYTLGAGLVISNLKADLRPGARTTNSRRFLTKSFYQKAW